jgi:hydrogenase nickel insertion protein HypA
MHEMSIAHNIIEIVNDELTTRGIYTSVEKVVFKAGKMNAIIPDSLLFHFNVLKREFQSLKDAVLEIDEVPIIVLCSHCNKSFTIHEPLFLCSECGNSVSIKSGQEMWIESILIED